MARTVNVVAPESLYFKVECSKKQSTKVAPGVSVVYKITFTPAQVQAYACDLTVVTEREKFIVPVRAVGQKGTSERDHRIKQQNADLFLLFANRSNSQVGCTI